MQEWLPVNSLIVFRRRMSAWPEEESWPWIRMIRRGALDDFCAGCLRRQAWPRRDAGLVGPSMENITRMICLAESVLGLSHIVWIGTEKMPAGRTALGRPIVFLVNL